jgi:hypothetical protein
MKKNEELPPAVKHLDRVLDTCGGRGRRVALLTHQ